MTYIVDTLIPACSFTLISGPPKHSRKTWTALYLALRLARGEEFLGHRVSKPVPVTYVSVSEPAATIRNRFHALDGGHGGAHDLIEVACPDHNTTPLNRICRLALESPAPHVVIIDPALNAWNDALSYNGASIVIDAAISLRDAARRNGGAVICIAASSAYGEAPPKGFKPITAVADAHWTLTPTGDARDADDGPSVIFDCTGAGIDPSLFKVRWIGLNPQRHPPTEQRDCSA